MRKMLLFILFFINSILLRGQQMTERDSLLKILPSVQEDSNKVKILYEIGDSYENSSPDTAKHFFILGGSLSKKINYTVGIQKYYRRISYVYMIQSNYDSVLHYNLLGLALAKNIRDTFSIGVSLFNIGVAYRFKSDYESAVFYSLEGAKLLEGKGYTNIESGLYDGLQVLYMSMANYEQAIYYGEKAVTAGRLLKEKNSLAVALNNLALSYMEVNQLEKAKKVLKEAITISELVDNKSVESSALNNLGEIAIRESRFDLLKIYGEKSLRINTELNSLEGMSISNLCLAIYYLQKKEFTLATQYCSTALQICEENNFLQEKAQCLETQSYIAFAMNDFSAGFTSMQASQKIEGELFNESLAHKEAGMKVKFDTEKKELKIKELESEKQLRQLALKNKNILNLFLLGTALAIVLVSLLTLRTLKQKQRLQQQRINELETEKQLAATEAVLKGEEQERTRIAKDLHDGLGGMLSGIKYSFTTMKGNLIMTPESQQAFERSMDMLDSSIQEMRRVAHNMMPEALVRFGLDTALKDFCNDINQSGALDISYQSIGMEGVSLEQTTSITIYRIVQELLNNTMKHAKATSAIVQINKTNDMLTITVEDDGKGFDTEILKVNKGIGWLNIQNRVEFLKGKLDLTSKEKEGTSVQIELIV